MMTEILGDSCGPRASDTRSLACMSQVPVVEVRQVQEPVSARRSRVDRLVEAALEEVALADGCRMREDHDRRDSRMKGRGRGGPDVVDGLKVQGDVHDRDRKLPDREQPALDARTVRPRSDARGVDRDPVAREEREVEVVGPPEKPVRAVEHGRPPKTSSEGGNLLFNRSGLLVEVQLDVEAVRNLLVELSGQQEPSALHAEVLLPRVEPWVNS